MLSNVFYEPLLYVYPSKATLCYRPVNRQFYPVRNREKSNLNLKKRVTNGLISLSASKAISNCIGWMELFSKVKKASNNKTNSKFNFRLGLVTLTLPCQQFSSDKHIKREMLNAWLVYAKKYFGLTNYVWRAESQANGNIHFHIVVDVFIHYKLLRSSWNRICESKGYSCVVDGVNDPNSTDIHSLASIRDVVKYMVKYCTKNEAGRRLIDGALWGASDKVRNLGACVISAEGYIRNRINDLAELNEIKVYSSERAFVIMEGARALMSKVKSVRKHLLGHYNVYLSGVKESINTIKENLCTQSSNLFTKIICQKPLPLQLSLSFDKLN
jgi:hypothetical protein